MQREFNDVTLSLIQGKYLKSVARFERALFSGRFATFSQYRKAQLFNRLRRYARQLGVVLKQSLVAASMAAGLLLAAPAQAQTFTARTGTANPLNSVSISGAKPRFVDIDNDGDKDVFIGRFNRVIHYYQNTGTAAAPTFVERTGAQNPLSSVSIGYNSIPVFVDIDNDGDQDAFVGFEFGIAYFRNTGTASAPAFVQQTGTANPFNGVFVAYNHIPAFVDIDNDGDKDVFVGVNGSVAYFRNTGTASAPVFVQQTGTSNPLNNNTFGASPAPAFFDIDGDGDQDLFMGAQDGTIPFYRNTGTAVAPVFTAQTGISNPFNGVDVGDFSNIDFTDIDNDGDRDAFIGALDGMIRYYQNTPQVLPVDFISFSGRATEGGTVLIWETAQEVDNKGFDVERLSGGVWESLGFVASKGQSGVYSFVDAAPLSVNYYRLRQLDYNGKETVSKVITLSGKSGGAVKVYPTVARDYITVEGLERYDLVNALGQVVASGNASASGLSVVDLSVGYYWLRGVAASGEWFTTPVVKQ